MSKITVTILGTTAGVPTKNRAHAAIYLSYGDAHEHNYLFDCGENAQRQIMIAGLNLMKIKDCFITHWHGDHCLGLPGLIDTMKFDSRKNALNIYVPEPRRAKQFLKASHSMGKFQICMRKVVSRGKKITKLFENNKFTIVSTPVHHSVPAVGYGLIEKDRTSIDLRKAISLGLPEESKLYKQLKEEGQIMLGDKRITLSDISETRKGKKIVYSGDTKICDNLKTLAQDADLLIQDCTYFSNDDLGRHYEHAALPEVVQMAKECNVKKVILTHISRKYQDVGQLKELVKDDPTLLVAEDFMKVHV